MTKHSIAAACTLALAAFGFSSTSAFAGSKEVKEVKELKEVVKESCITGDLGVQFVSQYVSRGAVLENQGVIAQPYLDLYFKLYSGDGFINNVTLALGLWSSLHSEKTQQGVASGTPGRSTTPAWYEFDYTVGINTTFAKNFTLGLTYLEYNYPNDNFDTQRIGQVKLSYNDADLLGKFALNPYAKYEYYFQNPDGGQYMEFGITPGLDAGPVRVNFPVVIGLGFGNFYSTHTGSAYMSGGVNLSYNLSFIPECYGKWAINAGYTFYWLDKGNALDTFNTGPGGVRDESTTESVFSGGIGLTF